MLYSNDSNLLPVVCSCQPSPNLTLESPLRLPWQATLKVNQDVARLRLVDELDELLGHVGEQLAYDPVAPPFFVRAPLAHLLTRTFVTSRSISTPSSSWMMLVM